jgi:hypothetical protein
VRRNLDPAQALALSPNGRSLAMTGSRNGTLGAILAALMGVALAVFLLSGGENVGKKTVNSDADLPPIAAGK